MITRIILCRTFRKLQSDMSSQPSPEMRFLLNENFGAVLMRPLSYWHDRIRVTDGGVSSASSRGQPTGGYSLTWGWGEG
jgi:hypothetical protein